MKSLAELWILASVVIPPDAPAAQRRDMRRAFYMGAQSALSAMAEASLECGDDDDKGAKMIETLHRECREFAHRITRGEA